MVEAAHRRVGALGDDQLDGVGGLLDGDPEQLTLAGGYRYAGRHELYFTLKAGRMDGSVCFD